MTVHRPETAAYAAAGLVACIIAANWTTTAYGMVPVGFGLTATAGTYLAGATFVLRDSLQDAAGKRPTIALIIGGAALSFALADPFIALASGVAFLLSELADLAVWSPLRSRGYVRAAVASNVVGSTVDTLVFLWIAGFPVAASFGGQMIGKLLVTLAVVALVVAARHARRVQ